MSCNHKRVWEVQFWDSYRDPESQLKVWLCEGFEPFPMGESIIVLKRLKPCEECAENDKRRVGVLKRQAEESDQRCVEMIKEHNGYMAKRYPGHTPICPT